MNNLYDFIKIIQEYKRLLWCVGVENPKFYIDSNTKKLLFNSKDIETIAPFNSNKINELTNISEAIAIIDGVIIVELRGKN